VRRVGHSPSSRRISSFELLNKCLGIVWCIIKIVEAKCGVCHRHHMNLEEYRTCSQKFWSGQKTDQHLEDRERRSTPIRPQSSPSVEERLRKIFGRDAPLKKSATKESMNRENARHRDALVGRRNREAVLSATTVFRSIGKHHLSGYLGEGSAQRRREGLPDPWIGYCSCGSWRGTRGSPESLVGTWKNHVNEYRVRERPRNFFG